MQNKIPETILASAVGMLSPWSPGLTTERLLAAINFQPEDAGFERLLTRSDVARALRVSLPTVDRMLRDGDLPKRRIRGAVRIPASAVSDIVSNRKEVA